MRRYWKCVFATQYGQRFPSERSGFSIGSGPGPRASLGEALSRPKSRSGPQDPVTFVGGKGAVAALPASGSGAGCGHHDGHDPGRRYWAMINPGGTSGGSANHPPSALGQDDPSQTKPEHGTGSETPDTTSSRIRDGQSLFGLPLEPTSRFPQANSVRRWITRWAKVGLSCGICRPLRFTKRSTPGFEYGLRRTHDSGGRRGRAGPRDPAKTPSRS